MRVARCLHRLEGVRSVRACCAALAVAAAACTARPAANPEPVSPKVRLRVLEFNIEYGGEEVAFSSVVRAIRRSDADVVGVEEAWGNTARIAQALGWRYFDPRTQVVSRYPLLAPPEAGRHYTFVAPRPGRVIAVGNVHLPSSPYGPNQIRAGMGRRALLALERRTRVPAVGPFLHALSHTAGRGIPSFLMGDFNSPSKLDWTRAAVGSRPQIEYAVRWPVSAVVEDAGFRDSYREVHPDPVASPGLTWPALRPFVEGYNPARHHQPADRIDFIYAAGPAKTLDSVIVGEPRAPGVAISIAPWPTDHRAVLSTFAVEPASPPTFVSVPRRLIDVGRRARATWHLAEGDDASAIAVLSHSNEPVASRPISESDGTALFATSSWPPGRYVVALRDRNDNNLSSAPFWLQPAGARPRISTTRKTYAPGEPITVRWRRAPGNRWDWVGIYKRAANPHTASYLTWLYTNASIAGSARIGSGANGTWPLRPGRYSVYLLEDDGYDKLAGGGFTIHPRA